MVYLMKLRVPCGHNTKKSTTFSIIVDFGSEDKYIRWKYRCLSIDTYIDSYLKTIDRGLYIDDFIEPICFLKEGQAVVAIFEL